MLNTEAIRPGLAPKDGNWGFNISELEGKFPAGTVDNTVEPVYKEVFFIEYPFHIIIFRQEFSSTIGIHTSAQ